MITTASEHNCQLNSIWFWAVAIVLNNDNRPEQDGTAGQLQSDTVCAFVFLKYIDASSHFCFCVLQQGGKYLLASFVFL